MDAATATLLVSCPDRKGIVASLAQLLYGHGANILDADPHLRQQNRRVPVSVVPMTSVVT